MFWALCQVIAFNDMKSELCVLTMIDPTQSMYELYERQKCNQSKYQCQGDVFHLFFCYVVML